MSKPKFMPKETQKPVQEKKSRTRKVAQELSEQEKIMLNYYKMVCVLYGINTKSVAECLTQFSKMIIRFDNTLELNLSNYSKEKVGDILGLSLAGVDRIIKELTDHKVLERIRSAVYSVAPEVLPQSEWEKILDDRYSLEINFVQKKCRFAPKNNNSEKLATAIQNEFDSF